MSIVTLTETGENTFTVPEGVYKICVTCIGANGCQTAEDIDVYPSQEIFYYIEQVDDTKMTFFGPYACSVGNDGSDLPARIIVTLYNNS